MPGIKASQQDIEQFVAITQASHDDALHFLEAGTTLEGAIEDYYAAQTAAAPAPSAIEADDPDFPIEDVPEPSMSENNQNDTPGAPRTLGGAAAEPLPAGWGRPEPSRFGRIQHNDGGRGDDDDDKPEELYAGGGRSSGLAVENPDGPSRSGNPIVDNILRMARENGSSGSAAPGPGAGAGRGGGASSLASAFRGTGNTLGSDETPSSEVADAASPETRNPGGAPTLPTVAGVTPSMMDNLLASMFGGAGAGRGAGAGVPGVPGGSSTDQGDEDEDDDSDDDNVQTRRLTFWRDGFSIEDGPLLSYDEPANQQLLTAIEAGRAPPSVFGVRFNQRLNVEVAQRRKESYQPPPKRPAKAFEGSGNRLGSVTPEVTSSVPGALPAGILVGGSGSSTPSGGQASAGSTSQSKFAVDESKPTTNVQLRLGDGTRLVARVNLDHTIGDLRNYVSASRPDSRAFIIQTTFPSKELSDYNETVESAKLQNAVVVQRYT